MVGRSGELNGAVGVGRHEDTQAVPAPHKTQAQDTAYTNKQTILVRIRQPPHICHTHTAPIPVYSK